MSGTYGSRFQRPLGVSSRGWAGAGENLGIEALAGDTDMVTVFDDFNGVMPSDAASGTTNWETSGWLLTDINTATASTVMMNSAATAASTFNSCINVNPGTKADSGINMQLSRETATLPATGGNAFPHIWIADTGAGAAALDNSIFVFACRIGLISSAAAGWDGKAFIGWAENADASIMTNTTGVITIASTGPLVGFHIPEDGSIDAVSHRTVATAMAEGTNFTELHAAAAADNATAGVATWWDLALRMQITNQSDDAANGATTFYSRQVPQRTSPPGSGPFNRPGQGSAWARHSTVLTNQTPNNDVALVPTIEVLNGPTNDVDVLVDWWSFGVSRFSR